MRATLYNYWRSSCSWRIRIALNLKGIEYEYKPIDIFADEHKTPEFLSINPRSLVPLLNFDGKMMADSVAIMEYLDERFPDKNPFLPKSIDEKFVVRSLVNAVTSNIQPVQNMGILRIVGEGDYKKGENFAKKVIELRFNALEKELEKTSGKFTFGDRLTMADIVVPPQVHNAVRYGVDMSKYPTLTRLNESLSQIPEFSKADAWKQPDTPVEFRK
ncbi:hypothetical protein FO519_007019 [Halicephalobus sp. NKZ332]|nr:hypothetical protein FO519_007019 [Halicephalobus sp. NKZ332]